MECVHALSLQGAIQPLQLQTASAAYELCAEFSKHPSMHTFMDIATPL